VIRGGMPRDQIKGQGQGHGELTVNCGTPRQYLNFNQTDL